MKNSLKMGVVALPVVLAAGQVHARAHCFADINIVQDNPNRVVTANRIWDERTNGRRWYQHQSGHRAECNGLASNYFNSLDLAQYAKDNGMCGTITASGTSWIGTSRKKGSLGPRSVEVPCSDDGGLENVKADYQYSTKAVCGEFKEQLNTGQYSTLVNVHNPSYDTIEFRYKFATAGRAQDGDISFFTDSEIGPDGAQYFDCDIIKEMSSGGDALDGFFVIESREPLDVVGYYSGGAEEVATLDVETTRERLIEDDRVWGCGDVRQSLWRATEWTVNGQPAVGVTHFNDTPIFDFDGYQHGGIDGWLSTQARLDRNQTRGDFDYQLPFCLCNSQEYPTGAAINVTALRADNSVSANIDNGTPFITSPNTHDDPVAGSGSANVMTSGQHFLEFASNNGGRYHAVGFGGTIAIRNGYLGICAPEHQ